MGAFNIAQWCRQDQELRMGGIVNDDGLRRKVLRAERRAVKGRVSGITPPLLASSTADIRCEHYHPISCSVGGKPL